MLHQIQGFVKASRRWGKYFQRERTHFKIKKSTDEKFLVSDDAKYKEGALMYFQNRLVGNDLACCVCICIFNHL